MSIEAALASNLREAIFAQGVLLCEGPTDAAVLQGVADSQGGLDKDGVAVADCGSKRNVGFAIAILKQLEIPFFVLFDGDASGKNPGEATKNKALLGLCGEPEEDWPNRGVRDLSANFQDKLESDLEEIWPEFIEARASKAAALDQNAEKNVRIYREAARDTPNAPDFVVEVLEAVRGCAKGGAPG
jgi:predicted ATP-dependent endonuclease of OLD family